jgi:hypothetical protein
LTAQSKNLRDTGLSSDIVVAYFFGSSFMFRFAPGRPRNFLGLGL